MRFSHMLRRTAAIGLAAFLLAGCVDISSIPKHLQPLSKSMKMRIAANGMAETSPILIRIFKEESVLEVWKADQTGRFALLSTYDICKWSGKLGPKIKEGDRQAPEGFYTVTPAQLNPNSNYHLAFNLGFPNAYDQAQGRTGTFLMVHGACSSAGCYSMTDEQIQEIYTLARLAFQGGQRSFQVQAFPFRMTPQNMAKHRRDENYAFWKMLKEGHDHFEVTGVPPKVAVCSKRYVFNAEPVAGVAFNPTGECPAMSVPDPIRTAVAEKAARDTAKETIIAVKLGTDAPPVPADGAPPAEAEILTASVPAAGETVAATAIETSEAPADLGAPPADPAVASAYAPAETQESGGLMSRLKDFW